VECGHRPVIERLRSAGYDRDRYRPAGGGAKGDAYHVSGINWHTVGRDRFDDIVDILLAREFGDRGHPVDGRGGDEGIDYTVDDDKIIFQYKYFPEGFPSTGSRRKQITRSFRAAMIHNPDEWILVVPAKVTPGERKFVMGLGKDKPVKISIRDRVWLNDQLANHRDIAEYYRHGSDIDLLYAKGEMFKHNPVIRDMDDVAGRMVALQDSVGMADPNWALDVHSVGGKITQVIRAKDPNAAARSPITIKFTAALRVDSLEAQDLENANAFGYTKPIILPGDAVKNFQITGPRLVAWEGDTDSVEIRPEHGTPQDGKPAEFVLRDKVGAQLGVYLANIQHYVEGMRGFTLLMRLGGLLDLTFRHTFDPGPGVTHFSTRDFTGAPVSDVFTVADFMVRFAGASSLEIHAMGERIGVLDVADRMGESDLIGFESVRSLLDDLMVIEAGTGTRFRYPAELPIEERIMIRNLRLMLEGHCVAHPSFADVNVTLSGARDTGFSDMLTTELRWMMQEAEYAEVTILGQQVVLTKLSTMAAVRLEQQDVEEVKAAFQRGDAAGMEVTFHGRPGDRVRMFLRDRFPSDRPSEITPWGIPGVRQQGLGPNGEPLDLKSLDQT
jgi:hypothetical protein